MVRYASPLLFNRPEFWKYLKTIQVSQVFVEEKETDSPSSDGLLDGQDVVRVGIALDKDLDSFAQLHQLISNISHPRQTLRSLLRQPDDQNKSEETHLDLDEVLVRPRDREASLLPLFPDVEERKVVPSGLDKVLARSVRCKASQNQHATSVESRDRTHPPTSSALVDRTAIRIQTAWNR